MQKNKSRLLIAFAVIVALILLASAYYWFIAPKEPQQINGNVDHKGIQGIKDDTSYGLVTIGPHGLSINPAVSDLFIGMDVNMTVTADLERELEQLGYEVRYHGSIVLDSSDVFNGIESGACPDYFLSSRDDFNRLVMGSNVTIEVSQDQEWTVKVL